MNRHFGDSALNLIGIETGESEFNALSPKSRNPNSVTANSLTVHLI